VDEDWRELNRAMWDERVPVHVASAFHDVEGFRAGRCTLQPEEVAEVGDVAGRRLVHLQCHFGLDSMSWARRGASVTGLDVSRPAVEAAGALAAELGLDARFVHGDLDAARDLLDGVFDVVDTGGWALCRLPDIPRWAEVVDSLLAPGGFVSLWEFHPVENTLADDAPVFEQDCSPARPVSWESAGTDADPDAVTSANRSIEWIHPTSEVIGALLDRGLRLELFREETFTHHRRFPFLTPRDGRWHMPEGMPLIPMLSAVRARGPAPA
jgi:SAM-dependent methyltransferase